MLWLLKKCFFHLSTCLDYNMFFICSQGSSSFLSHLLSDWPFPVWGSRACVKATYPGALVRIAPRVPWGGEVGAPWPSWAETILELIQAGPIWPRDWEHVFQGVNAMLSLKSSGRFLLLWPFSLGFQWKFNTKKRKALIFISALFQWCKSMQVLEGHLPTETLPVYQPHIRRQR